MTGTTSDSAARTTIATDTGSTLFVNAGAGSGKTTALVSRLLRLVETGQPIESIAAITFTEAAASELKVRIRERLAKAAVGGDRWATEALERLDSAAICTLHAFASRILQQFPTEAGLPPRLQVLDPVDSHLAFEQERKELLDIIWSDVELSRSMTRLAAMGVADEKVTSLFKVLGSNWDRLEDESLPDVELSQFDLDLIIGHLRTAVELGEWCIDDSDKLKVHLDRVAAPFIAAGDVVADRLSSADPVEQRSAEATLLDQLKPTSSANPNFGGLANRNGGSKDNWGGIERKKEVAAALEAASTAAGELIERAGDEAVRKIAWCAGQRILAAAQRRQRAGELEFHDLLVLARRLLRSDEAARVELSSHYSTLLLDEFQDTDPIQIELAVLLAAGRNAKPDAAWSTQEVPEGSVFFVGDPNQSIYRFRRADVALYRSAQAVFVNGHLELSANFRSVPGILDWVNETFDGPLGSEDQAGLTRLEAQRDRIDSPEAPVTLLGGAVEDALAHEIREVSAKGVADHVHRMIRDAWPTVDDSEVRALRYSDITVLVPARTGLPQLERAFDVAGIPYRLDSSSLLWASQSIQDLLNILQAVSDPTDDVAVVASLRSPVFGCGDDDLVRWVQAIDSAARPWDHSTTPDFGLTSATVHERVSAGMEQLRDWHAQRWWLRPDELVDLVLREGRFFETALTNKRPRDHWRRLRFVAAAAQEFAETRQGDLREFLSWSRLQGSDTVQVVEPRLSEHDDDAVSVMTIHGSKGLEFPAVIVYGLSTRPSGGGRHASVLWDDEGAATVSLSSRVATRDYEVLKQLEDQMDVDERNRLLYVAATRARDWLAVSLTHGPKKGRGSAAAVILGEQEDVGDDGVDRVPDDDPASVEEWFAAEEASRDVVELVSAIDNARRDGVEFGRSLERWRTDRAVLLEPSRTHPVSATALAHAAGEDVADEKEDAESYGSRRGVSGTAIGSAVHETLELVAGGGPVGAIAAAKAVEHGVESAAHQIEAMVDSAIGSPLLASLHGSRFYRELYVAADVGGRVVEGYIDLLAKRPDGTYVLVDYKTDAARSSADIARAVARYRPQLATYALLLKRSANIDVSEAHLLFLTTTGATVATIEDLPGAIADVHRLVGSPDAMGN